MGMDLNKREQLFKLGFYNLDRNENLDRVFRKQLDTIVAKSLSVSDYPDYPQFLKRLSSFLGISPTNFTITCGCTEAIKMTMDRHISSGTPALVLEPTYQFAVDYLQTLDAHVYSLPYDATLDEIVDTIRKEEIEFVYLCNPNNPTGTKFNSLEKLANLKATIFVDESYHEFAGVSSMRLATQTKNIIVGRSFSKAWGLAGLRLGLLISNDEYVYGLTPYKLKASVNSVAVRVANELVNNYKWVSESVERIKRGGDFMRCEIEERGWKVFNEPNVNFIWCDIPPQFLDELNILYKTIEGKQCITTVPLEQAEEIFRFR